MERYSIRGTTQVDEDDMQLRIHHIHAAIERFTLKRKGGGRGFINLKKINYIKNTYSGNTSKQKQIQVPYTEVN